MRRLAHDYHHHRHLHHRVICTTADDCRYSTSPVHLLLLLAVALLWVALWRVALLCGVTLLRGVTLLWGVAVLGVALCRVATWLHKKRQQRTASQHP
jgi:hypothetical protein